MSKKILSAILAAAMTAMLAACGGSSSTTTTAAPAAETKAEETKAEEKKEETKAEETKAEEKKEEAPAAELTTVVPGKLTVGTSPDFAPYEFYHVSESGEPELSGFDVALAKRIADDLGLELQIIPIDFDGILMELQNGNIDLGISGFSPSPERKEVFDFSDIYYLGGQSFCVHKDNKDKYTSYDDFKGLPVGAQNGSIQYGLAQENTPDANIIGLAKVTDIVSELVTGKLEGAFIETAVAEQYAKNYPELCIAWEVPYDAEGSAIAIQKGNEAMLKAVNEVIANALADGTMADYIAEAGDLASDEGNVYEGQLDAEGKIQQ
ncbi:MAG: transporter substrate-binding domain-containing protein [Stomatobaculum sp.]|nr:transporter substrate-binding domain-containing protein [Stomatobaculum sp.]